MKAVCLISGGIDSPVAAKLMVDKGVEVVFLHGSTSEKRQEKVRKIVNIISPKAKIFFINHKKFLQSAVSKCHRKYTCILCKRFLYREAERLCREKNASFIITGESIGQVASQTLKNISVLDQAVSVPIVRPLIGLNKQDIITIAKSIKTYDLSIQDAGVCNFVPIQPATSAALNKILAEEEKLLN